MYKLYVNGRLVMKDSFDNVADKVKWYSSLMEKGKNYEIAEVRIEKA